MDLYPHAGNDKKSHTKQLLTFVQRVRGGNSGTLIPQSSTLPVTGHNIQHVCIDL